MTTPDTADASRYEPTDSQPGNKDQESKKTPFSDYVKLVSAIGVVLIPLVITYVEYRQSIERDQDKIFREIVTDLSSTEKEKRVTGATNIGAYIRSDSKYHDVAVDILINFVALESDLDVLKAISWSLSKIDQVHFNRVLNKLLDLNRNMVLNDQVTQYRVDLAKKNWDFELIEFYKLGIGVEQVPVTFNLAKSTRANSDKIDPAKNWRNQIMHDKVDQIYTLRQKNLEMDDRRLLAANFIALFLINTPAQHNSFVFNQNSLNYIVLENADLKNSTFLDSALSQNLMQYTDFSNSSFDNTVFAGSRLEYTNFSNTTLNEILFDNTALNNAKFNNATFSDVFFLLSDLAGADFTGAKGLKPVYFYRASNKDKAIFDPQFRKQLDSTKITHEQFKDYVINSGLTDQRYSSLMGMLTLSDTVYSRDEIPKPESNAKNGRSIRIPEPDMSGNKNMIKDIKLDSSKLRTQNTDQNQMMPTEIVSTTEQSLPDKNQDQISIEKILDQQEQSQ